MPKEPKTQQVLKVHKEDKGHKVLQVLTMSQVLKGLREDRVLKGFKE